MRSDKLFKKFTEGLEMLNYTEKDVRNWKSVGCGESYEGDKNNQQHNYHQYVEWINWCNKKGFHYMKDEPEWEHNCVCGTKIKHNYYITPNDDREGLKHLLVTGSCCINHFLEDGISRHCDKCRQPHKNRKDNICNECRLIEKNKPICKDCKKFIDGKYLRCFDCMKKSTHKCIRCDKMIDKKYKYCFNCKSKPVLYIEHNYIEETYKCDVCHDSGYTYLSDECYGGCIECGLGQ
jgi:hypothetical protein